MAYVLQVLRFGNSTTVTVILALHKHYGLNLVRTIHSYLLQLSIALATTLLTSPYSYESITELVGRWPEARTFLVLGPCIHC